MLESQRFRYLGSRWFKLLDSNILDWSLFESRYCFYPLSVLQVRVQHCCLIFSGRDARHAMVAGGASQLFSDRCPSRLIHRRFMASHSYPRLYPNRLGMISSYRDESNVCTHSKSSTTGALRLRNCLDRPEGVFRRSDDASRNTIRAVAPYSSSNSLIHDDEARAAKLANSLGGSSLGSSNHSPAKKFVVAVHVDEGMLKHYKR